MAVSPAEQREADRDLIASLGADIIVARGDDVAARFREHFPDGVDGLADGDTISVIKDLKVKGTSTVVKVGTKVKNIRLVDGDHDIDCKIPGIGPMYCAVSANKTSFALAACIDHNPAKSMTSSRNIIKMVSQRVAFWGMI